MATPDYLICPISLEPMIDPVICSDGTTYERSYIEQWLEDHDTSPKTNQRLDNKKLIPNYSLKSCLSKTKAKRKSFVSQANKHIPPHNKFLFRVFNQCNNCTVEGK